jgi:hypothetical protein
MEVVNYRIINYPSGDTYTGMCINGDIPHGYGVITSSYRNYQGGWNNGKSNGYGILVYYSGEPGTISRYEGGFKDDRFHGEGTATYFSRPSPAAMDYHVTYSGGWTSGQWKGHGLIKYANGDQYEGGVKNGNWNGYGVYTPVVGSRYEGGWKNNKREGPGVEIRADGSRLEGTWKEGHGITVGTLSVSTVAQYPIYQY